MLLKSIDTYRMNIRTGVRGLWTGEWDYFTFLDQMSLAIEKGFTQAWHEGAKIYGIEPGEMTQEEHIRLTEEVNKEVVFISNFGQAIISNSKVMGGKLTPLFARAELWVAAYNRVRVLGSMYAARDQKAIWRRGMTRESCSDCKRYAGRIYRMSTWRKYGAIPRAYELACRGYHCQCFYEITNLPATPGRPPSPTGK